MRAGQVSLTFDRDREGRGIGGGEVRVAAEWWVEQETAMATGPEFMLGQEVRVWYSSARAWKVARIRAFRFHGATGTYTYELECEGRINTHSYRADQLQPVRRGGGKSRT